MLSKLFRLSKKEFLQVKTQGRLASGQLMGVLILELSNHLTIQPSSQPKAGLIVSKKISSQAVVRNRLKRRLRAALQRILPQLNSSLRLVVLPNRRASEASVEEMEKELRRLLSQFLITRRSNRPVNHKA